MGDRAAGEEEFADFEGQLFAEGWRRGSFSEIRVRDCSAIVRAVSGSGAAEFGDSEGSFNVIIFGFGAEAGGVCEGDSGDICGAVGGEL